MSETTHTPLPWRVGADNLPERHTIRGANGEYVCRAQHGKYGNADLIVTAVNHHAELVALVRDLERTAMRLGLSRGDSDEAWAAALLAHTDVLAQARTLLARIEEK